MYGRLYTNSFYSRLIPQTVSSILSRSSDPLGHLVAVPGRWVGLLSRLVRARRSITS